MTCPPFLLLPPSVRRNLALICLLLAAGLSVAAEEPGLGRLRGTVHNGSTGAPLTGVEIFFLPEIPEPFSTYHAYSDNGSWESLELPPGRYRVLAANFGELIGVLHPNVPCGMTLSVATADCDPNLGALVEVRADEVTSGIALALPLGGAVVGRVSWRPSGAPAVGADIEVIDRRGDRLSAVVDAEGNYRVGGLSPNQSYYLNVRGQGAQMVYPDLRCDQFECRPELGGLWRVGLGQIFEANQDLPLPPELAGRVSDRDTGAPLAQVAVVLRDRRNGRYFSARTDAAGLYRFGGGVDGPPAGSYWLYAEKEFSYLKRVHPDVDLDPGAIPDLRNLGGSLDLAPGAVLTQDLTLRAASTLRGKVLDKDGQPATCQVRIFDAAGKLGGLGVCDASGDFAVSARAGSWRVLIAKSGHAGRWVGGESCWTPFFDEEICLRSTPVFHQIGELETREIGTTRLLGAAQIFGTVSAEPETGDEAVDIYDHTGRFLRSETAFFTFRFRDLAPGRYYLRARSSSAFGHRLYPNLPCDPDECQPLLGEPIDLVAGQVRSDIDFTLSEQPGRCRNEEACLLERRFRLGATWRDPLGQQGEGQALYLGDDASVGISFFSSNNPELFVKVLDACYPPYNHYWVVVAGLTDVGVELTVEDTVTGNRQTYSNPLGQTFAPIFDFTGFPCGAAAAAAGPAIAAEIAASPSPLPISLEMPPPATRDVTWPIVQERCFSDSAGFCQGDLGVFDSRFEIAGQWTTASGEQGSIHQAFTVGGDSEAGGYYFFGRDNVELFVKILDGCHINNRRWLLVAGLTDVGVELSVRDRIGGGEKVFRTSPGQRFTPLIDVEAFPCTLPAS